MAEALRGPSDFASPEAGRVRQDARFRALFRLIDRHWRQRPAYKLARILSGVVALACGAAMLALVTAGQSRAVFALSVQALGWVSWTTGAILGLSSARGVAGGAAMDPVRSLVLQRGFSREVFTRVEVAASALRFALLVAVPGVALGLVSVPFADSWPGAARRLLACAGMLGYALLFGATMVLLTRSARALAPNAARSTFAALVLGPLVLAELEPAFPSIPGFFAVLREQLLNAGLGA